MDASAETVVRISSPADILGVLPYRLGFHPSESIIVICLQGPRRRDVLVMRLDLLPPAEDEKVAADLIERAMRVEPSAVVLACYTEAVAESTEHLVRAALIDVLEQGFEQRGVEVVDALLVQNGHWWSYVCTDPSCCPVAGSPLLPELTAAARTYAAEAVGQGDVLLRDRAELVRSVRPNNGAGDAAARADARDCAAQSVIAAVEQAGVHGLRRLVLDAVRELVQQWCDGNCALSRQPVATILLGLRDKSIRDEVMILMLDTERKVFVPLLVALAAAADDEDAAPICTVLAWVAYSYGDGSLANVAIERALECDPAYELAKMLAGGLDAMVPPDQVRAVTARARDDLRAQAWVRRGLLGPTDQRKQPRNNRGRRRRQGGHE
jgi:hypothetical protein